MSYYSDERLRREWFEHLGEAFEHDPAVEHSKTPLWREVAWPADWLKLRLHRVFYGLGVPHGSGEPVLLIPGFMSGDLLMLEMHRWLRRIGYRSSLSGIAWNTDCPDVTARHMVQKVRTLQRRTGSKVILVGHSLGGMIAKHVVQEVPELVDRVITLGSPFKSLVKAHPYVLSIWDRLKDNQHASAGRNLKPSCATGYCTCGFVRSILKPGEVSPPQFAVYSKLDGVADWRSCMEADAQANTEVQCTHIGMVVNPEVFEAVAERLAQGRAGA